MNDDASARGQAVVAGLTAACEAASYDDDGEAWKREVELSDVRRFGGADLPDDEIRAAMRDLEALGYVEPSEAADDLWLPTPRAEGGLP